MTTKNKAKVRKVKAWAIVFEGKIITDEISGRLDIFDTKESTRIEYENTASLNGTRDKIRPIEITIL